MEPGAAVADRARSDLRARGAVLARALARPLRAIEPVAFRVEGELHVFNAPDHVREELSDLPDVSLHDIAATRRPRLERVLHAAAELTEDDMIADPLLEDLTRLDAGDDDDERALEFARIALVLSGRIRPRRSPPLEDWRSGMTHLLAGRGPPSRAAAEVSPRHRARRSLLAAIRRGRQQARDAADEWLPPLGPITVRRGERVLGIRASDPEGRRRTAGTVQRSIRVPPLGGDADGWTDEILDAVQFPEAYPVWAAPAFLLPAWELDTIVIPDATWAAADRELVFALAALLAAVPRAEALPLPSGTVLLPLGNGIFAELYVREDASAITRGTMASLAQPVELPSLRPYGGDRRPDWRLGSLTEIVPMYAAETSGYGSATTELGARLPRAVYLAGHGLRADVTFMPRRSSPRCLMRRR